MQQLTKNDYIKLRNAWLSFNNIDESEQVALQVHAQEVYHRLCQQFIEQCKQNPVWVKLYDMIQDYEQVTNFKIEDNFRRFIVPEVGDNCDGDFQFEYDPKLHDEAREIAQNIAVYTQKANQKLAHINSKKFVFRRGAKIAKLNEDLNYHKLVANKYANLEKQDALKKHYLIAKTAEYKTAQNQIKQINRQCADQIIAGAVKDCPGIIWMKHDTAIISSDDYHLDSSYLNDVCDDIKEVVKEMMVITHENSVPNHTLSI